MRKQVDFPTSDFAFGGGGKNPLLKICIHNSVDMKVFVANS